MYVTVELNRAPGLGNLRAHIVDNGQRGKNLLAGDHFIGVQAAKRKITRDLAYTLPDPRIKFVGPENEPEVGEAVDDV